MRAATLLLSLAALACQLTESSATSREDDHGRAGPCANADEESTFEMISASQGWRELHAASRCAPDDGVYAELFGEAIARLLITRWETLPQIDEITGEDWRFRMFVLDHLDDTISMNEWAQIQALAATRCPSSAAALCEAILRSFEGAGDR